MKASVWIAMVVLASGGSGLSLRRTELIPFYIGTEPIRVAPDGDEPQVDYPDGQWIRNIGSRIDGSGMCVFTSYEMMCRWSGLEEFRGFRDWCAAKYPGGGYPEKLAKLVKAYCQAKNVQEPEWWQYEGPRMDFARTALKTGRMICTTLYTSPRYRGTIYHMTNLAHFGPGGWGAILDNNGNSNYDWGKEAEVERWVKMSGRVWLVGLKSPGPPPAPWN